MCVTSLLCGPRADLWPFYEFLCKQFSLYLRRRVEPLERIYGRFPSVDQLNRFAGVPSLGKPLYIEKKFHIKPIKEP